MPDVNIYKDVQWSELPAEPAALGATVYALERVAERGAAAMQESRREAGSQSRRFLAAYDCVAFAAEKLFAGDENPAADLRAQYFEPYRATP